MESPPRKTLKQKTFSFLHHPVTDLAVIALIILSVGLLLVEYGLELDPGLFRFVEAMSVTVTLVFAVELSLRYWVAKKKSRFFRRYWPDILAIIPLFRPFRFLRILRLLRLFRLGLLLSRRVTLFRGVFRVNIYEVWVLLVVLVILVIGSATMMYFFESRTTPEFATFNRAFWWALDSLIAAEPIGGTPKTIGGRLLLVGVMLSGMTLFAVFTGVVSATVISRLSGRQEVYELDIDELEGHILVCGWNAGVPALISELAQDPHLSGLPIVLVTTESDLPEPSELMERPELFYLIRGDHTKLEILERAGAERASRAVVMADSSRRDIAVADRDARTVLAALTLERVNPEIFCTVELMDASNEPHLKIAGVEAIVMRNDLSGRMLASACRHPKLVNVVMEMLTMDVGETLYRIPGPQKQIQFGELVAEYKRKDDILVVGVEKADGTYTLNPPLDEAVSADDHLIVIGDKDNAGRA